MTDVTANDGQWHLICATWSSPNGKRRLYCDEELKDKGAGLADNTSVHHNGTAIVGQEQDARGGDSTMRNLTLVSCTESNCGTRSWTISRLPD